MLPSSAKKRHLQKLEGSRGPSKCASKSLPRNTSPGLAKPAVKAPEPEDPVYKPLRAQDVIKDVLSVGVAWQAALPSGACTATAAHALAAGTWRAVEAWRVPRLHASPPPTLPTRPRQLPPPAKDATTSIGGLVRVLSGHDATAQLTSSEFLAKAKDRFLMLQNPVKAKQQGARPPAGVAPGGGHGMAGCAYGGLGSGGTQLWGVS